MVQAIGKLRKVFQWVLLIGFLSGTENCLHGRERYGFLDNQESERIIKGGTSLRWYSNEKTPGVEVPKKLEVKREDSNSSYYEYKNGNVVITDRWLPYHIKDTEGSIYELISLEKGIVKKSDSSEEYFFVDAHCHLWPSTKEGNILQKSFVRESFEKIWQRFGLGIAGGIVASGLVHLILSQKLFQWGQGVEKKIWKEEITPDMPSHLVGKEWDDIFGDISLAKNIASFPKKEGLLKKVLSRSVRHGFWVGADILAGGLGFYLSCWMGGRWRSLSYRGS